jgi:hypothetical protein
VKTLDFVSILVLAAATTFACDDDGDRVEGGSAGKTNAAGSAGKTSMAGTSNDAGTGGASAGASGNAGETSEGGASGAAGSNEGGAGGESGGAGGESGEGGAAGTSVAGGAAGEGGAGGQGGGGAEGGAGAVEQAPLEIIGSWDNNFGGADIITATEWSSFGAPSNIVEYENDANVVYTESSGMFSKIVYTDVESDSFYYCIIDYGKATLAEAIASTKVADSSDPDASGCGGFSWTKNARQ